MKRRGLLRGALSTCVLSLGGISAYQLYLDNQNTPPIESEHQFIFLQSDDRMLLEILIPVFISGREFSASISTNLIMSNIDNAIIRLPERTQAELRELFTLLGSMLGRLLLANVWKNWRGASNSSVDSFLNSWRESQLELLQVAYKGLHKLIIGSTYSEAETWPSLDYAGPPFSNIGEG
ncbi:MAG: hypothetical protein KUG78_01760 [Kangiellaceae bacterium]|nr:hypothetical protein [Kangiellaceae bacterium]